MGSLAARRCSYQQRRTAARFHERIAEGTPVSLLVARQHARPETRGGGTLPVDRDIELAAQTAGSD